MYLVSNLIKYSVCMYILFIVGLFTVTNMDLANAEKYSNDDIGFSFEYPDDWNIIKEDYDPINNEMLFFEDIVEINDGIFPNIKVSVKSVEDFFTKLINRTQTSMDHVLETENSTKKNPNERLIGISKIDIGEDKGDKITYMRNLDYNGQTYYAYIVESYLQKDNYMFMFELQALSFEMTDREEEVYNDLLKSFNFEGT